MSESTNILRRMEASRRISRTEANSAFAELLQLEIKSYPFAPFAERIWELRANLTRFRTNLHTEYSRALPMRAYGERICGFA